MNHQIIFIYFKTTKMDFFFNKTFEFNLNFLLKIVSNCFIDPLELFYFFVIPKSDHLILIQRLEVLIVFHVAQ